MKEELTAERKRYRLAGTLELFAPENGVYARCHAGWCSRLETSSYTRALQGEPVRRFTYFARHQIVASQLPFLRYFSVGCLE
jgi:hypothetical protein